MDALPVQEKTNLSYASKIDGKMHACGHDGHTAGLLGVALILNELKDEFCGTIKFYVSARRRGKRWS
ncbi:hypothetical protein HpCK35_08880 [Helicobacter pylori]|nr:amidohydrolase [Campylobacter jejuni subsp. doylei]